MLSLFNGCDFDRINSSDFIELFAFPRQLIHRVFLSFIQISSLFFFAFSCNLFKFVVRILNILNNKKQAVAL